MRSWFAHGTIGTDGQYGTLGSLYGTTTFPALSKMGAEGELDSVSCASIHRKLGTHISKVQVISSATKY